MTTVIENDQNIQNSPCVEAKGFARIRPSRSGLTGGASGAGCRHGLGPEQACPTCEGRSYAKSASQLDFMERGPETEDVPPGRMRRALPEQSGATLHDLGAESRIWLAENCTRDTKAHHSGADKQTIRGNKMPSNLMPGINEMRAGTIEFGDPATDEDLVASAKEGDEQAFEMLVRRHRPKVFALALRYTRVREDAEDVVQQTFQKAFVYLSNFEGKSSFSTWLTRIAINEALMWLRKARALREVPIDDSISDEGAGLHFDVADARPDPEATYLQREETRALSMAIKRLTPRIRIVLELKELRELSARETARQMGLSLAAVKARVSHGREKLRKHIAVVRHARTSKIARQ